LKNFLIIDSGSTKSDWAFVSDDQVEQHSFLGINPATGAGLDQHLPSHIIEKLQTINAIYFYGAGTNTLKATALMEAYLRPHISISTSLSIDSDLLAAARACAGNEKGIICILGTGSNSCLYDGNQIIHQIPSLGYLMSDEGSGCHIGKEIVKAYFYGDMLEIDSQAFDHKYHLNREILLGEIYGGNRVSAYLASFAPFLLECSNQLKTNILTKVFHDFIELRVKKYTNFSNFDIYFVGSIAAVFEENLKAAMKAHNLEIKSIVKNPIQNLIFYHKSSVL
jgi:glucosamine kinase